MNDAFFHLKFAIVGRARGTRRAASGSAVAMSAYQRCSRAIDAAGTSFDFRRKRKEYVTGEVLLPDGAPTWAADPDTLWQRAEAAEKRVDAQLSRVAEFAIPRQVPDDLAMDFARHVAEPLRAAGMAVQIDVHDVPAVDGQHNRHCHLQMTLRRFDGDKFAAKKERAWNQLFQAGGGTGIRVQFANQMNEWLAAHQIHARVDPRPNSARGLPMPEADIGRAAIEVAKRDPDTSIVFDKIVADRQTRRKAKDTAAELVQVDAEIEVVDQAIAQRRDRRGSVAPRSPLTREERRKRLFAMLLARRFDKEWIPAADAADITQMRATAGDTLTVVLRDGSRLVDRGDRVDVHGQTDLAISHAIRLVELQDWTDGVELSGKAEFRLRLAAELLDRRPPVPVSGLSDRDRQKVDRELARRATERRPGALAFASAERARLDARLRAAPTSSRRQIVDRIDVIDRAAAAIQRGDPEMIRVAHNKDVASLERLVAPLAPPPEPESASEDVRRFEPTYRLVPKSQKENPDS